MTSIKLPPEFDEEKARSQRDTFIAGKDCTCDEPDLGQCPYHDYSYDFVAGAQWQHSQDVAIISAQAAEIEELKYSNEWLRNKVIKHREAYSLKIFPNSEVLTDDSSRDSISAKMGRHMCDCFLDYMAGRD